VYDDRRGIRARPFTGGMGINAKRPSSRKTFCS
jgi:hypothetical protein